MQLACTVPTVPSHPLLQLSEALAEAEPLLDDLEDDDPLLALVGAAEELITSWSFYPETEYGSDRAIMSADAAIALIEALDKYRQETAA